MALSRSQSVIIIVLAGILGLGGGLLSFRMLGNEQPPAPQFTALKQYPQPRPIADFALSDHFGDHFSKEQLSGRFSLLFFGFTYCPDICPNTLGQLRDIQKTLREKLPEHLLPRVILVSVDPERDTPEKLRQYVQFFDPEFLGVTGPHPQLTALSRQLGILYEIEEHEPGALNYNVDHSAALLLLGPDARLNGVFTAPHDSDRISTDLINLLQNSVGQQQAGFEG